LRAKISAVRPAWCGQIPRRTEHANQVTKAANFFDGNSETTELERGFREKPRALELGGTLEITARFETTFRSDRMSFCVAMLALVDACRGQPRFFCQ
jgi:hypothetical protein